MHALEHRTQHACAATTSNLAYAHALACFGICITIIRFMLPLNVHDQINRIDITIIYTLIQLEGGGGGGGGGSD